MEQQAKQAALAKQQAEAQAKLQAEQERKKAEEAKQQALLEKQKEKARQQEAEKNAKLREKQEREAAKELRAKQQAEAKAQKRAASNFKYYLAFTFFIALLLMIIFLPNISDFFNQIRIEKEKEKESVITSGTLVCKMNTNDDRFDYYYEANFDFRDSQMYRLNFTTTIKGDRNLDALELSNMKNSCDLLKSQVDNLSGVRVSCSLNEGVYENEQILDYSSINEENVTAAYVESGGTYPNYTYHQNIDKIEQQMNASNYTCERIR